MIQSPDPASRTLAARILLWQAAVTAVIALICYIGWGARPGLSALAGGGIGVLANLFMTLTALRPSSSAAGALGRLLLGQFMKVAVTVVLFVLVARTGKVVWPALLVAFIAPLVVFWFVPALAARARRVKVES
ncbi:MAG: ATP synthase subunit I [Nevskiaceae bacterium]|nr:ATP synthase subunit I [Nevskiaceae bacterium]